MECANGFQSQVVSTSAALRLSHSAFRSNIYTLVFSSTAFGILHFIDIFKYKPNNALSVKIYYNYASWLYGGWFIVIFWKMCHKT